MSDRKTDAQLQTLKMSEQPNAVEARPVDCCNEDDYVIIDVNRDRQSLVKLKKGGTVRIGKVVCSMDPLLGASYGSLFDLDNSNRLEKRQRICEAAGEAWDEVAEINANNSELLDAGNANQALSTSDIEKLRAEGKTGDEIIAALTASSATFLNKTQYSQEKYKKKKAKKYLSHVSLIRPCARALAEFYFQKMPMKIGGMRADTLAILLSLANTSSGSRTLVVDNVGGLVAGAAIERMGGQGTVVNAFVGDKKPSQDIASCFNFAADFIKAILVSLGVLREHCEKNYAKSSAAAEVTDQAPEESLKVEANPVSQPASDPLADGQTPREQKSEKAGGAAASAVAALQASHTHAEDSVLEEPGQSAEQGDTNSAADPSPGVPPAKRAKLNTGGKGEGAPAMSQEERERMFQERRERMQELCRQGFQSCIVACPTANPTCVMKAVLPLLTPSASFSMFFPSMEPLTECLEYLKSSKYAIGMHVQESWWREYQVLPGRTHPTMATSGTGGFILSGTTVLPT